MPHPLVATSSRSSSYGTFSLAFKALSSTAVGSVASPNRDNSTLTPPTPPIDETHVARIINGYVNSKFARGARGKTTVAYVGAKVDELERAAAQLDIACLPAVIARSRQLHGMPVTDPSLPSSAAVNRAESTIIFDRSLAPEDDYLPPYRASATAP